MPPTEPHPSGASTPQITLGSEKLSAQGSTTTPIPNIPITSPLVCTRDIRSPRKTAAIGTVHSVLVHTRMADRPGGRIWRA